MPKYRHLRFSVRRRLPATSSPSTTLVGNEFPSCAAVRMQGWNTSDGYLLPLRPLLHLSSTNSPPVLLTGSVVGISAMRRRIYRPRFQSAAQEGNSSPTSVWAIANSPTATCYLFLLYYTCRRRIPFLRCCPEAS